MALDETPNKLESVWIQRNTENQYYEQVNISGSDLIVYHSSSGELQADKISTWAAKYGLSGGGGTTVKVSATDTTAGYLLSKIVAGPNVTINQDNVGGNEKLSITASSGGGGSGAFASSSVSSSWASSSYQSAFSTSSLSSSFASSSVSASYAKTSSYATTASYAITASHAISASWADSASSAATAFTAYTVYAQPQASGQYNVGLLGSNAGVVTTDADGNGDFLWDVTNKSIIAPAITSSLFGTASLALNAEDAISASYALSASWADNAGSSSWSRYGVTASILTNSGVSIDNLGNGTFGTLSSFFYYTLPALNFAFSDNGISNANFVIQSDGRFLSAYGSMSLDFVTGSIFAAGGVTGSLLGTASYSISSSLTTTASYSISSSWANKAVTASILTGSGASVDRFGNANFGTVFSTAYYTKPNTQFSLTDGGLFSDNILIQYDGTISDANGSMSINLPSGSIVAQGGVTASLLGTASFAVSASYASASSILTNGQSYAKPLSDTIAVVAGTTPVFTFGDQGGSYNLSNIPLSASAFYGNLQGTASVSNTASLVTAPVNAYAFNTVTFPLGGIYFNGVGQAIEIKDITGTVLYSFGVATNQAATFQYPLTASLMGTSSWARNAVSASYALTASYALNGGSGGGLSTGSSYPITSSWATSASRAVSSIFAETADFALDSQFCLSASYAVSTSVFVDTASYVPIGRSVALCAGYTPTETGADAVEIFAPYAPDGTTIVEWNIRRISIRTQTPETTTSSFDIEKSVGTGVFSATTVGSLTLNSGSYETYTGSLSTVASGDKLRFNVTTLGNATNWTIITEISNA